MDQTTQHSDHSESQTEVPTSVLDRLYSYSLVNSVFANYQAAKDYSPLVKGALESVESVAEAAVVYSAPHVSNLSEKLGVDLDQKANELLDHVEIAVETVAVNVGEYYEQGQKVVAETQQNLAAVKQQVTTTAEGYAQTVSEKVSGVSEFLVDQKNQIISGEAVDKLLDKTESFLDSFLPPDFQVDEVEIDVKPEPETALQKASAIGYKLPTRIKRLAQIKVESWKTLNVRSTEQIESFSFVVDLIQYAADYLDVEHKKEVLETQVTHARENFNTFLNASIKQGKKIEAAVQDNVAKNLDRLKPIQTTIATYSADVKEAGVRAAIGAVAAVAHATELARRQLITSLGTSQNLQEELASFTLSTKKAILSLNSEDLPAYVAKTNAYLSAGLNTVIQLLIAYTPQSLLDSQFPTHLRNWQQSLVERGQRFLQTPQTEQPKVEETKAEEPQAEEPSTEEPKAEESQAEEPSTEEPKAEDPEPEVH